MKENLKYFAVIGNGYEFIYIIAESLDIANEIAMYCFKKEFFIVEIIGGEYITLIDGESVITASVDDIFRENNILQGYCSLKTGKCINYLTRKNILDDLVTNL